MTKMTNLEALNIVLNSCELAEEVREKITNIRNSYQKKAEYKPTEKKPTATQIINEKIKTDIMANLKPNIKYTLEEIMKNTPMIIEDDTISSNRVAQLLRQLRENGLIVKEEVKRKSYYSLA